MEIEKARIHSYICADGYASCRKEKSKPTVHYEINFYPDDRGMIDRFLRDLDKVYGIKAGLDKTSPKYLGCDAVRISNKSIYNDLATYGKYNSLEWSVPFNELASKKHKIEWIKCFFDGEAYVNHKTKAIQVKSINKKGLKDVKKLLLSLSIKSKIYGPFEGKKETHHSYYQLEIRGESLKKYKESISFYHSKKKNKLIEI